MASAAENNNLHKLQLGPSIRGAISFENLGQLSYVHNAGRAGGHPSGATPACTTPARCASPPSANAATKNVWSHYTPTFLRLVDLRHVLDQVHHAARVAPLVVVPSTSFTKVGS